MMKSERRVKCFKKARRLQVSLFRLDRLVDTNGMLTDDLYHVPILHIQEPMLWEERHSPTHAAPSVIHN